MNFTEKFERIKEKNDSLVCVGLDSDIEKIPAFLLKEENPVLKFNKGIIESTKDVVCAYKLNFAFYEVLGVKGIEILKKTLEFIPDEIPVIADAKKNDIGNSARVYAKAIFKTFGFDGATVNPYLGQDSVKPFVDYEDKQTFVICRTSNPSAGEFQDLMCTKPLYEIVAEHVKDWNSKGNCGLVAGATYPAELKRIREIVGDAVLILIPGVGKQKGDVETVVKYGVSSGKGNAIINSSRAIIFAGDEDFRDRAREEAIKLRDWINSVK